VIHRGHRIREDIGIEEGDDQLYVRCETQRLFVGSQIIEWLFAATRPRIRLI
jgi:hypothetical protein